MDEPLLFVCAVVCLLAIALNASPGRQVICLASAVYMLLGYIPPHLDTYTQHLTFVIVIDCALLAIISTRIRGAHVYLAYLIFASLVLSGIDWALWESARETLRIPLESACALLNVSYLAVLIYGSDRVLDIPVGKRSQHNLLDLVDSVGLSLGSRKDKGNT
jgi:hypothetical protein